MNQDQLCNSLALFLLDDEPNWKEVKIYIRAWRDCEQAQMTAETFAHQPNPVILAELAQGCPQR